MRKIGLENRSAGHRITGQYSLSAGLAPHFHARSDLPEVVTNPGLLLAIDVIGDAAIALANHGKTKMSKGFVL